MDQGVIDIEGLLLEETFGMVVMAVGDKKMNVKEAAVMRSFMNGVCRNM
jgi:hypothetical protein